MRIVRGACGVKVEQARGFRCSRSGESEVTQSGGDVLVPSSAVRESKQAIHDSVLSCVHCDDMLPGVAGSHKTCPEVEAEGGDGALRGIECWAVAKKSAVK